jgi:hypothetical protein
VSQWATPNQTLQSFRQAVYTALTVPPLTYMVNNGAPQTLPVANVAPRSVWNITSQTPDPAIFFDVAVQKKAVSRYIDQRWLTLRTWCVATASDDTATALYEASRLILHRADQEAPPLVQTLSRIAGTSTFPLTVVELLETRALPASFEKESARWYVEAWYEAIAQ